jgi:hypothetical protein
MSRLDLLSILSEITISVQNIPVDFPSVSRSGVTQGRCLTFWARVSWHALHPGYRKGDVVLQRFAESRNADAGTTPRQASFIVHGILSANSCIDARLKMLQRHVVPDGIRGRTSITTFGAI